MWIDSHCHLNDEAYYEDLDVVLDNMANNDVRKAMLISLNLNDLNLARKINHKDIIFKRSIAVFPTDSYEFNRKQIEEIYNEFNKDDINAIGEIGLDYHWDKDHKDIQKQIFKEQLNIAKQLDKPVIIHSRDAAEDTFNILKESGNKGVMHCYSGSKELAKEYVKIGFYISIAGPVTFKNAKEPLEVIEVVPLDRLLIETDSPYLTPVPKRGQRNEPANVRYTGEFIANRLGIEIEEFKRIIESNYERLFNK